MGVNRSLYVLHTADKYELPLFVGDKDEMSKFLCCSVASLYSKVSKRSVVQGLNAMVSKVGNINECEVW